MELEGMSTCFGVVIREEWEHHRFAVRDLSVLGGRH
jgi:hypothetical protein